MKDGEEQKHLFMVGYEAGQRFMSAVEAGIITPEEAQSNVPVSVGLRMSGPTAGFVLGRIFEAAATDAYDDVAKKDASGMALAMEDWVIDSDLQLSLASSWYLKANCKFP